MKAPCGKHGTWIGHLLRGAMVLGLGGTLTLRADGPSVGILVLPDNGEVGRFEIAADELELRGDTPSLGAEKIAPEPSLTDLRAHVRRRASRGEEVCLVLYEAAKPRTKATRRVLTRDTVVHLAPGVDPAKTLADLPDGVNRGELGFAPGFFLVTSRDCAGAPALAETLRSRQGVIEVDVQLARHYDLMLTPNDSYFTDQWNLLATSANSGPYAGQDLRVTSVWDNYRGSGITIGIIDSGVQMSHPDLAPNIDAALAYDFIRNVTNADPVDLRIELHGTAVAGIAAARGNNGRGVAGVAYEARLAPHRLIAGYAVTDLQIANAFSHRTDAIQIKNSSWGHRNYGTNLGYAGPLMTGALATTAETGRGGRGTIHVFSAGNDGQVGDNVNYDNLRNTIWSVPAAAIAQDGTAAPYSTPGAALVVGAPSGRPTGVQILTTDLTGSVYGYNTNGSVGDLAGFSYTAWFGGTSAAAAMVSGVVALMLQANPNLGWRDVQEILLRSATKNAPADSGWATNSGGIKFHHSFGGGMVNASNAVAMARNWLNLPPATNQVVAADVLALAIPDNNSLGVTVPFNFTNENLRVEHVRLRLDADHTRRGDLKVTLTSPGGMVSRLAKQRGDLNPNYKGWTFMSRAHWGEKANGIWTLRVADLAAGETGTLLAARLEVLGTYVDPVRLESWTYQEVVDKSNGNGYPDSGETLQGTVWLRNTTSGSLTGLTATLTCSTTGVTVLAGTSAYAVITAGQSASNATPFVYHLAKNLCGSQLQWTLVASLGVNRVTNTFWQLVGRPLDQPAVTNLVASRDTPKPVPDVKTVFSTLAVPSLPGHVLDDVDVLVRIDHTAVGDLQIALQHPDGTEVILSDHRGGNQPNFGTGLCGTTAVRTVFDDAASQAIASGEAPFAASYRPDTPLSALKGRPPGGNWRLRVSDTYDGDSGTLNCWSVRTVSHLRTVACEVFNVPPTAAPLAITLREGTSTNSVLPGADGDGDTITFLTNAPPQHGTLTRLDQNTGAFTYAAKPGYSGPDSFTFGTSDGFTNSAPATVTITIVSVLTNATFARPVFQPAVGFQVQVAGAPGTNYVLEATTNFVRWDEVVTNAPEASPFWLLDPQATNLPYRFYRLRR